MAKDKIVIKGAREHNLKNINLELPRDKFIVMTGLSGSGKSSLAFDTIYAEGQRRYVESLSAYARQFLGQMNKPDVDHVDGLSPAISIDQKTTSKNPRSTVGTVTEIYDYLRLLYARIGVAHCHNCGAEIKSQTAEQIVEQIVEIPAGKKFLVLAPIVKGRKGEYRQLFKEMRQEGFTRVRVDGTIFELEQDIVLDKNIKHTIELVVDRLVMKDGLIKRLNGSVELALKLSGGMVAVAIMSGDKITSTKTFSEKFACLNCNISYTELQPRMFSFNSPYGACSHCGGLGVKSEIDSELVVPEPKLSLAEGAIVPWKGFKMNYYRRLLEALAETVGLDVWKPFQELSRAARTLILYGEPRTEVAMSWTNMKGRRRVHQTIYEGVIPNLTRRYQETESEYSRAKIEGYMRKIECPQCLGARLRPESLAVTIGGLNISELTALSINKEHDFIRSLSKKLSQRQLTIGRRVIKEIRERLKFLVEVGLDYLTLDRAAASLSGGEAQRIRLATQIGSGLMGVLYVLDEPSIGLHQRDNKRLIMTLKHLKDLGNTLIVVEHDEETIRQADFIVDIGPRAGESGGRVVAVGSIGDVTSTPDSITGDYLSGRQSIPTPEARRSGNGKHLIIRGAVEHNLKGIDVTIPLGVFIAITGLSGSGKSTLISDILAKALAAKFYRSKERPGKHESIDGLEHLDKVIEIDQSPIGRTPRSNPATYSGVFTEIRNVFAEVKEAKIRGYKAGRFSFNVKGGRCEACRGDGTIKIEMHFLPDIYVTCEACKGARYNAETLKIKFKGKNIAEVLAMSVADALKFFANIPKIKRRLQTLYDVGLGYIKLGQPAPTLSGGEAQRVKLASELGKIATGRTLYILDEPTTGLHFDDVNKLLSVLQRLVDSGNTVLVIEHNLDVVKTADHIIDLGPEGGDRGGEIVAIGTPEEVAANPASYTGQYLLGVLGDRRRETADREASREREE